MILLLKLRKTIRDGWQSWYSDLFVFLRNTIINSLVGSALWLLLAVLEPPVDISRKVQTVIVDFGGDIGYHYTGLVRVTSEFRLCTLQDDIGIQKDIVQ